WARPTRSSGRSPTVPGTIGATPSMPRSFAVRRAGRRRIPSRRAWTRPSSGIGLTKPGGAPSRAESTAASTTSGTGADSSRPGRAEGALQHVRQALLRRAHGAIQPPEIPRPRHLAEALDGEQTLGADGAG